MRALLLIACCAINGRLNEFVELTRRAGSQGAGAGEDPDDWCPNRIREVHRSGIIGDRKCRVAPEFSQRKNGKNAGRIDTAAARQFAIQINVVLTAQPHHRMTGA